MFATAYDAKYKSITSDASNSLEVLYKNTYDHSKIYCWLKNDSAVEILAGSANFTNSSLKSTNEEFLFHVDHEKYNDVLDYLKRALICSVSSIHDPTPEFTPNVASLPSPRRARPVDTKISHYPPTANIYLGETDRKIQ